MEEISHRIHDAAKKGSIEDVARLLKVIQGSMWVELGMSRLRVCSVRLRVSPPVARLIKTNHHRTTPSW